MPQFTYKWLWALVLLLICLTVAAAPSAPHNQLLTDPWDLSDVESTEVEALSQAPLRLSDIDWSEALLGHWHNKIVHFPLLLALIATVLRWRCWWNPTRPPTYSHFLSATAALILLAAFTGQQQAMPFTEGPLRQVLSLHQALGVLGGLGFGALVWLDQRFPNRYLLFQTLALSLLLALLWGTALLGGLLATTH